MGSGRHFLEPWSRWSSCSRSWWNGPHAVSAQKKEQHCKGKVSCEFKNWTKHKSNVCIYHKTLKTNQCPTLWIQYMQDNEIDNHLDPWLDSICDKQSWHGTTLIAYSLEKMQSFTGIGSMWAFQGRNYKTVETKKKIQWAVWPKFWIKAK